MSLVEELKRVGVIQTGEFILKSGQKSTLYFDCRRIISHPDVFAMVTDEFCKLVKPLLKVRNPKHVRICGVPDGAVPLATAISIQTEIPLLMVRKTKKEYGMQQMIEGDLSKKDEKLEVILIEDVVTTGSSIRECISTLSQNGIRVIASLVLLNRASQFCCYGLVADPPIYSVLKMSELLTQPTIPRERKNNLVLDELKKIMQEKKTNLCVAADLTTTFELIQLIHQVGPYICLLKIHADIISDWSPEFITKLIELSIVYQFLLFEDRKFADIGNTVELQYTKGIYKIMEWAHLVTIHSLPGPFPLQSIRDTSKVKGQNRGVVLLPTMTAQDNLIDLNYTRKTLEMAEQFSDLVVGVITSRKLAESPFLKMTPGVSDESKNDKKGQQYVSIEYAMQELQSDILIVGRAILSAQDPSEKAKEYQSKAWSLYRYSCKSKLPSRL
jgi:uridine monophosphate synthetase